jgi:hypothetical protein
MCGSTYSEAHVTSQRQATRTLIKFCEDHGYDVGGVQELRICLSALDRNDVKSAVEAYLRIPLGGMGCFNDWLPPVVFREETPHLCSFGF